MPLVGCVVVANMTSTHSVSENVCEVTLGKTGNEIDQKLAERL